MRRLQLLGKSRHFLKGASKSNEPVKWDIGRDPTPPADETDALEPDTPSPTAGMLGLPEKILLMILADLDNETLVNLCLTNSTLYKIIADNFLYKTVRLTSKLSLLRFNALIHSEFHTINAASSITSGSQNARFLTRSVEFSNPQCQDSLLKYSKYYNKTSADNSVIGGAYSYSSGPIASSPKVRHSGQDSATASTHESRGHSAKSESSPLLAHNTAKLSKKTLEFLETLNKLEYKYSHYTYIELMLDIIDYLPNLSHIILSDVEPNFKIPLWYSVFNDGSKDFFRKIIKGQQSMNSNDLRTFQVSQQFLNDYERKFYALQRFKTLEIRAASDPAKAHTPIVPLRPNMLCCFGIINELVLDNVVIDTESLDTPMEFLPLYVYKEQKSASEKEIYDLHSTYNTLTLKHCHIVPGNGILRLFNSYFRAVTNLSLLDINSKFDLLLCNCFPALKDLTIDCNSTCFTHARLVNEDYYYKEIDDHHAFDENDGASIAETLLDTPVQKILHTPPPTTAVVLSLNLNYISRTTNDKSSAMMKNKPSIVTHKQSDFFHMSRIPQFHYCYHYYKNLFERIPSRNVNINVINIPFTNVFPVSPVGYWEKVLNKLLSSDQETLIAYNHTQQAEPTIEDANGNDQPREFTHQWDESVLKCMRDGLTMLKRRPGYDTLDIDAVIDDLDMEDKFDNFENYQNFVDIPNINLYSFLKQLSKFKSVKIQLLRKWLFCTPRTRYDWELLLKPLLNVKVPIEVRERDGFVLYSYNTSMFDQKKKSSSNIMTPSRS